MAIGSKLKQKLMDTSASVDMTTGHIRKAVVTFAIPIMIGNLFQQMYSMVDTAVVGRGVGSDALAAVGTTSPVVQLLLGLMIGMTSGMSVVIAQYFGAGNERNVRKAIANGIILISGLTVQYCILLSCLQEQQQRQLTITRQQYYGHLVTVWYHYFFWF